MNNCVKCGLRFTTWHLYRQHACNVTIRPENTSGRSKMEIVRSFEETLGVALIQPLMPILEPVRHSEACRCWTCQQVFIAQLEPIEIERGYSL